MKIIITTDNTGSMGQATTSAKTSAEEIRTMMSLLLGEPCVKISVYGDYDSHTPDSNCGGWSILSEMADSETRQAWLAKYMKPMGGGGYPEAQRTAFNHLLREEERCIVLHFTDAPPHSSKNLDNEGKKEETYLKQNQMETDWDRLSEQVKEKHRVVTFLTQGGNGTLTDAYRKIGEVVKVSSNTSTEITATMMSVLLQLIGEPSEKPVTYLSTDSETKKSKESDKTEVEMRVDVKTIMNNADPVTVIKAFDELLNPANPDQAVCLTTNTILGKYWRKICGKYRLMEEGKYEGLARDVMDKLSSCKTRMNATNQAIMKEWIDASHDDTPVIRDMVGKALPHCKTCLVLRGDPNVSLDDLLALGRSGVGYREMSKLLATLEEVSLDGRLLPEDPDQAPDFVPLQGIGLVNIFRLIANLVRPGILFSSSAAMIAAILSLPNKHLADLSRKVLAERKGKWIDFSLDGDGSPKFPVNYAINFIRILQLADNAYLTDEEIEFRDKYLQVDKLVRNHNAIMTVVTGIILKKPRLDVTWKRVCRVEDGGCGHPRCFTIFPGDSSICGICIQYKDPEKHSACRERGAPTSDISEVEVEKTHWAHCFTCKVNYGITAIGDLGVRPKCYYCRYGKECPSVECHLCRHKYVSQESAAERAMENAVGGCDKNSEQYKRLNEAKGKGSFVCPRCVYEPKNVVQESEVKLVDFLAENNVLRKLVPVEEYDTLVNTSMKLWKRVLAVHLKSATEELDPSTWLGFNGFTVHNIPQALADFKEKMINSAPTVMCSMCVEDTPLHMMTKACGSCPNRICRGCVQGWYGQVVAGSVVSQSHTLCPFCKAPPKHAVVKKLAQAHLRNIRPSKKSDRTVCAWDPQMWHAACARCLMVKPMAGRECAGEAPRVNNYSCDECRPAPRPETAPEDIYTQPCPGCGVSVEKDGGCNHIACSNCDEHWCWGCGKGGFDGHSVYDHMASCKGIFEAPEE